jgi:hypothetical protein
MKYIAVFSMLFFIISCKKKEGNPSTGTNNPGGSTIDTYVVRIESNYLRSTMSATNVTYNMDIKKYNTSATDSLKNCPISFTFTGYPNKKYRVYTYSVKNATDTTLYMSDSGLTWNFLQVKKNGQVIYEHKDTVGYGSGYGSQRITSNECKINY